MPSRRTSILRASVIVGVLVRRLRDHPAAVRRLQRGHRRPPGADLHPDRPDHRSSASSPGSSAASLFCVVIPGLSPLRGTEAYLILSGMGPSLPFGPVEHGRRLGRAPRLGRRRSQAATSGMALYGIDQHARPLRAARSSRSSSSRSPAALTARTPGRASSRSSAASSSSSSRPCSSLVVRSDRAADWVGRTIEPLGRAAPGTPPPARASRTSTPASTASATSWARSSGGAGWPRWSRTSAPRSRGGSRSSWPSASCGVPADVLTPLDVLARLRPDRA